MLGRRLFRRREGSRNIEEKRRRGELGLHKMVLDLEGALCWFTILHYYGERGNGRGIGGGWRQFIFGYIYIFLSFLIMNFLVEYKYF